MYKLVMLKDKRLVFIGLLKSLNEFQFVGLLQCMDASRYLGLDISLLLAS